MFRETSPHVTVTLVFLPPLTPLIIVYYDENALYLKRGLASVNRLIESGQHGLKIHTNTHKLKLFIDQSAGRQNKRIYSVALNRSVSINRCPQRTNCPFSAPVQSCHHNRVRWGGGVRRVGHHRDLHRRLDGANAGCQTPSQP